MVCLSQQVGLGLLPCFAGTPGVTHRAPPSLFSVCSRKPKGGEGEVLEIRKS